MFAGGYLVWATLATAFQGTFIYPFGPHELQRFGYELTVVDGVHLYHRNVTGDAPVVLFFMGNGGALAYFEPVLAAHDTAGRGVVAVQYPGGGGVDGRPNEALLKQQALVAFDWAEAQTDTAILVHGYSMGTSLAQFVAAERDVTAVILDAPFVRMCEVMQRAAWLPACYMPLVQRWDSAIYADRIDVPVLIQHGVDDALIPVTDGARLAGHLSNAGNPVVLERHPGFGHNDLPNAPGYRVTLEAFLTEVLAR